MMDRLGIVTLEISLGVTFLYTGYFILKDTKRWTEYIKPWAANLLPTSRETAMKVTGLYDLFQGVWLLSGLSPTYAAVFAAIHMITVLVVAGIDDVTYRDVGILGASLALLFLSIS